MTDGDFGKPIIAIANSFTQFVPGHVHLKDMGDLVAGAIREAGGVAKEFNTIAVDDGIAMGHDGMLYSLPSREVIADSVEYMATGMTDGDFGKPIIAIANSFTQFVPGHVHLKDMFVAASPDPVTKNWTSMRDSLPTKS